ncbi:MAG TPA: LolA-related protein [Steroidobacteraceae bacterium]|nr:LolA-related protein [Steroidobacteraceae bacterium]
MGTWRWMAVVALLPAAAALGETGSVPDVDTLLQHLTRPAPATTPFVEVHFSPLLSRPLIVSGEMEYDGPDALARTVEKPYSEHTQIQGDSVSVTRGKGKPRTFSLQRAPELKTLLSSFSALLGGNRAQLEQGFTLALSGDDAHWSLTLTPRDSRVSQRVSHIVVNGAAASPRCMTTSAPDGSVTVMLLEDAARTAVPPDIDRAALDKVCR